MDKQKGLCCSSLKHWEIRAWGNLLENISATNFTHNLRGYFVESGQESGGLKRAKFYSRLFTRGVSHVGKQQAESSASLTLFPRCAFICLVNHFSVTYKEWRKSVRVPESEWESKWGLWWIDPLVKFPRRRLDSPAEFIQITHVPCLGCTFPKSTVFQGSMTGESIHICMWGWSSVQYKTERAVGVSRHKSSAANTSISESICSA